MVKSRQTETISDESAIIEFLKIGNATLLLTVNDNFQKTVLQGRYKYNERDGLTIDTIKIYS